MEQIGYAEALNRPRPVEAKAALHSIEVVHHMTGAEPHYVMVQPGKMAEHIAGCEHCGAAPEK